MTGSVILEGNKETYKILISYNAQCEIEDTLGKGIYEIMSEQITSKNMRAIFMVGLRYGEGRKVNLVEAGDYIFDIITKHNQKYFEDKVQEAIMKALGMDESESPELVEETEGK